MRTKANNWGNPETGEVQYGLDVWVDCEAYRGWAYYAENGKLVLFQTEQERDAKRREVSRAPLPSGSTLIYPPTAARAAVLQ